MSVFYRWAHLPLKNWNKSWKKRFGSISIVRASVGNDWSTSLIIVCFVFRETHRQQFLPDIQPRLSYGCVHCFPPSCEGDPLSHPPSLQRGRTALLSFLFSLVQVFLRTRNTHEVTNVVTYDSSLLSYITDFVLLSTSISADALVTESCLGLNWFIYCCKALGGQMFSEL